MTRPGEFLIRAADDAYGTESRRVLAGPADDSVRGGRPTGIGAGLGHGIADWFSIEMAAFIDEVVGGGTLPPCQSLRGELHTVGVLDAVVRSAENDCTRVAVPPAS